MKKQTDRLKELNRIYEKADRLDEEVLKLLENDEEDPDEDEDDEEYEYIPFKEYPKPVMPEPAAPVKKEKAFGSCIIILLAIIFIICLFYTLYMYVSRQELHLIPLAITLICFAIIEVAHWIRKKH